MLPPIRLASVQGSAPTVNLHNGTEMHRAAWIPRLVATHQQYAMDVPAVNFMPVKVHANYEISNVKR
jgi:hypothetical protein